MVKGTSNLIEIILPKKFSALYLQSGRPIFRLPDSLDGPTV